MRFTFRIVVVIVIVGVGGVVIVGVGVRGANVTASLPVCFGDSYSSEGRAAMPAY